MAQSVAYAEQSYVSKLRLTPTHNVKKWKVTKKATVLKAGQKTGKMFCLQENNKTDNCKTSSNDQGSKNSNH